MNKRNKILSVSLEMFMNNGYEGTSLADIADRIGFSKPAIYYYFDDKQSLFEETCRLFIEQIDKMWPPQPMEPPMFNDALQIALGSIGEAFVRFQALMQTEDTTSMFRFYLFIYEAITRIDWFRESINNFYVANINHLSHLMAEGQEKGEIRKDIDPDTVSTAITALIEGALVLRMAIPDIDLESFGKQMADNIWTMVRV
jgi:AcrR family transcriptional regulator